MIVNSTSPDKACKFLGILLDDNLNWKHHVGFVKNKMSRAIFMLNQVKQILPHETLRALYFTLVHPYITYGILAWGNCGPSILKPLCQLQKRAIRIIHNAHYNSHTDPLFKSSGILKVPDQYTRDVLIFMHEYKHDRLPPSFNNIFKLHSEIGMNYQTRQSNLYCSQSSFKNGTSTPYA